MSKLFILNRTNTVRTFLFGGRLGVVTLTPYQALQVDTLQLDARMQRIITGTLGKVVLCENVPEKYIRLYTLAQESTMVSPQEEEQLETPEAPKKPIDLEEVFAFLNVTLEFFKGKSELEIKKAVEKLLADQSITVPVDEITEVTLGIMSLLAITEVVPDKITEVVPDESTEVVPDESTEVVPDESTEVVPDKITEVVPDESTEVVPQVNTKTRKHPTRKHPTRKQGNK